MKSKSFHYSINADAIRSLEDVIELLKFFQFGLVLNEKKDAELAKIAEGLYQRGLVLKQAV
jgi:hypothetical protein